MKKIAIFVGTRPNFIKISKFRKIFSHNEKIECKIIHTNQHYDAEMSNRFFEQLGIGEPDHKFPVPKGSQIEVIASIMTNADHYLREYQPDLVLVPGDVNSSMACAIAASRNQIPIGHIESGLRSHDRTMPEEINRMIIDDLSDLFFVTEEDGYENLIKENKNKSNIHFVGNTMIDSMVLLKDFLDETLSSSRFNLHPKEYGLVTFHRPSNVDNYDKIRQIIEMLDKITSLYPIVFPIHPRTKNNLLKFDLLKNLENNPNIHLSEPLGYLEFTSLCKTAKWIMTDSGGIQEESTYLGVPCLTIRENTERPSTIKHGSNTLLGLDKEKIMATVQQIAEGKYKKSSIPPLWDGFATERIVDVILQFLSKSA